MRWALLIEYDGAPFAGWQRQANLLTVQQVLEQAAARLDHHHPVASFVAGRTDSGVHAQGQVAMLDLPDHITARQVRDALNYHMKPHPIAIRAAAEAPQGWNPRFSAIERTYRYRLLNRPARPTLEAGRVWHAPRKLNLDAMQQAADRLLGHHDFTSFRAATCQANSPWRTLDRLEVRQDGELVEIWAAARSFLHHQVRNIVGTLRLVGDAQWTPDRVTAALQARHRAAGGPTAPPDGLCLMQVRYPHDPFTRLWS
jgi:tRNA pseudouridine38-40 synthase